MSDNLEKPLPLVQDPPQLSQRPPTDGVPKRKPVPIVAVTPLSESSTTDLETSPVIAAGQPPPYSAGLGLKQKWWGWNGYSKRKKQILLAGTVAAICLLALIIGLAVGLTKRGKGSTGGADTSDDDSSSNLPLPTDHGGPYTGDLTYYDPGLGSCGIDSTAQEMICAVSHVLFDAASIGSNPNDNPLCGLKVRIRRGDASVDVTIVDRCVGCLVDDLDVSPAVFQKLAEIDQGRVTMNWNWLDSPPANIQ